MFEGLIEVVRAGVRGERIVGDIGEIFLRDRWFTYSKFQETARYCAKGMKRMGLEGVEVLQFAADGKTLYGTWRAGFAWDVSGATLMVRGGSLDGEVLADYLKVPCSLAMWSGPTAKGGVEAEVVDVGSGTSASDFAGKDVRGKIVFANARAGAVKGLAAANGAVGILTDWNPQQEKNPDAVFWNNAFADDVGGWPLVEGDSRLFAFAVTRNAGLRLRKLLAGGEKIRVHAVVRSRIYSGEFPVVTGRIAGQTSEEVLVLGHAFEQGAKDNASGVACMLEAVRVLSELIKSGKLKRPRRGIRALVTNECFGTIGYVDRFPAQTRKTVAAMCLDETGIDVTTRSAEVQAIYVNPESSASYLDSLVGLVAEAIWGRPFNPWVVRAYSSSDNMIAHSSIGVPAVWMGCAGSRITWHNTTDVPERMSADQLSTAAVYTAVYLYFLANAGTKEAMWLAGVSAAATMAEMRAEQVAASAKPRGDGVDGFGARLDYLLVVGEKAVSSVLRLAKTSAVKAAVAGHLRALKKETAAMRRAMGTPRPKKLASSFGTVMPREAFEVVPFAAVSGPITYDPVPAAERAGHVDPRWNGAVNVALGWADGKRTVAECVVMAEQELRRELHGVAEEMLWCVEKGVIGLG